MDFRYINDNNDCISEQL